MKTVLTHVELGELRRLFFFKWSEEQT